MYIHIPMIKENSLCGWALIYLSKTILSKDPCPEKNTVNVKWSTLTKE